MQIDFAKLSTKDRYKLLVSSVVPRPIALVSSMDHNGIVNAAPYSFFNAVCDSPPTIVLGVNSHGPDNAKDTAANIRNTGEFVVNLVSEEIAQGMNITAVDFDPEVDEFEIAGFTHGKSVKVKPPYIVESPISFECRRLVNLELGIGRNLVVGEVLFMHVRDDLIDMDKLYIDTAAMHLIGRMHGRGWYTRTRDLFYMPRIDDSKAGEMVQAVEQRHKK